MNCPKHVEFHARIKFETLVHLIGFIVKKYTVSIWVSSYWWGKSTQDNVKYRFIYGIFSYRIRKPLEPNENKDRNKNSEY